MLFAEFLASRMRDKGFTLKRLSDLTGIAQSHLENMLHGNFGDMPSTPYFRGYVMRVSKVLDFDGPEWWDRIKKEDVVNASGPKDALPQNRYLKRTIPRMIWVVLGIVVLVIVYLVISFPKITGKPALSVTSPLNTPFTTTSTTFILMGNVSNADALYLSNGNASSEEEISIAADGSWQKTVLLQNGINTFEVSAKKLLGGETDITEEIISNGPIGEIATSSTSTATTSRIFPAVHITTTTPTATNTIFD